MSTSGFSVKRGFAAILVIGLVAATLILGALVYMKQNRRPPSIVQTTVQPTPSPNIQSCSTFNNANKNMVLTNTNYHYSISYPESLVVYGAGQDGNPSRSSAIIIAPKDDELFQPKCPYIAINVRPQSYYATLDDFVQYNYKMEKSYNSITIGSTTVLNTNISDLTKTRFSSETAYMFSETTNHIDYKTGTIENSLDVKWIMFEHSGNYFYIISPSDRTLDQILSTFKFLDSESSSE